MTGLDRVLAVLIPLALVAMWADANALAGVLR